MIQWQPYINLNLEEANCLLTSPIPENPLCNVIRNKNPSLHIFLLPCGVVVGGAASGNLHIRRENIDIINLLCKATVIKYLSIQSVGSKH